MKRIALAIIAPLAVLASVELVLTVFHIGHPTGFFLRRPDQGRTMVTDNPRFGWRFVPSAMDRKPRAFSFPQKKEKNAFRVFVLGGSAALGDPDPAYAFCRILEMMMREAYPDRRIEMINAGMVAINSYAVREIAESAANYDPDLFIIYTGNNEVIGTFGPGNVWGSIEPNYWIIRAALGLSSSRTGQMMSRCISILRRTGDEGRIWRGMNMFLDRAVRHNDARLPGVYDHYARNLRSIVSVCRKSGADVILCTVGTNIQNSAPFGSMHQDRLPTSGLMEWDQAYRAGIAHDSNGALQAAIDHYQRALSIDGDYAELHYRLAVALRKLGEPTAAKRHFLDAVEKDVLRFRADAGINKAVKTVASEWTDRNVHLVDAERLLSDVSRDGLPGRDFFYDHVHLNFNGNYRIARGLFEHVVGKLELFRTTPQSSATLTETECAARLAFTEWDEFCMLKEMKERMSEPPFIDQADHAEVIQGMSRQLSQWSDSSYSRDALSRSLATYGEVLARRGDDWIIRSNLARLFGQHGRPEAAAEQCRTILALLPHYAYGHHLLATMLTLAGNVREAAEEFQKALAMDPYLSDARNNYALLLWRSGKPQEAETEYREDLRRFPNKTSTLNNLAWLLATTTNPNVRNATEAVQLAEKAAKVTGWTDPKILDTLAAAYAAFGDYEKAVELERKVLEMVRTNDVSAPIKDIETRMALYLRKQDIRQ